MRVWKGLAIAILSAFPLSRCDSPPSAPDPLEPRPLEASVGGSCKSPVDLLLLIDALEESGELKHGLATAIRSRLKVVPDPEKIDLVYENLIDVIELWEERALLPRDVSDEVSGCLGDLLFGTFVQIDAGGSHSCALTSRGQAYCWGSNESGQLGDGTFTDRHQPVRPAVGLFFSAVSVGGSFTCGLSGGTAYCWGNNVFGQLGDGSVLTRSNPAPVASGLTFRSIYAGSSHICGLTTLNDAYCWGSNSSGEIGDGTSFTDRLTPTLVIGGIEWSMLSAAVGMTCGLNVPGDAFCWGGGIGLLSYPDSPTPVLEAPAFTLISVGAGHVCGLTATGAPYCWGNNLGNGVPFDSSLDPVEVLGSLSLIGLESATGGSVYTCGFDGGKAYCWGDNDFGQLGDGTMMDAAHSPVAISGGLFTDLGAGGHHACGIIAGRAFCWGFNDSGQLGDGTTTSSLVPVPVTVP